MTNIQAGSDDGILVLRIDRPPVNALDVETLEELSDHLDEARAQDVDGVVVTGTRGVFSAGADLQRILAADATYVETGIDALSRNFRTLFTFSRPLVAAVNGHALGGGCVITCASDHRIMGSHGSIGAVELAAGVPFPSWALEVIRHNVPAGQLQEVVLWGKAYTPHDALRIGLIDEVVADEGVMARAVEVARELARVPRVTYAATKAMLRQPSVAAAERAARETDDDIKRAWNSDEARAAILRQLDALRNH